MGSALQARRVATAAAYGGGGLVGLGAAVVGLLLTEVRIARRLIGEPTLDPVDADGRYEPTSGTVAGPPVRLVVLGDSSAASLGVERPEETIGALLSLGITRRARRVVDYSCVARVGAESGDLAVQVDEVLALRPDVAVIAIGGNDVTHRRRPQFAVRYLQEAVSRLRASGCAVVVATCPDLGTVRPVPQPLRAVARRMSRQLAAAQTIAVVAEGGRTVSLGDLLGPEFAARPDEMFSADRFHPSVAGYAAAARAILPSVLDAIDCDDDEQPARSRNRPPVDAVLPVAKAAVRAASAAGSEVSGAPDDQGAIGPRGRWARLRRIPGLGRRRAEGQTDPDEGPDHEQGPGQDPEGGPVTELAAGDVAAQPSPTT